MAVHAASIARASFALFNGEIDGSVPRSIWSLSNFSRMAESGMAFGCSCPSAAGELLGTTREDCMDTELGWRVDGLEADLVTTLWPLSAVRDCSILDVSVRALAVLRKVSSLNSCSSSLTLLRDCSKIASRSKIDFCAYCRVFIYFCGSISLQLRDIMLIRLISKTNNLHS